MSKRKRLLIITAVIVMAIALVSGIILWFYSPGIHSMFGHTRVDIQYSGYILDSNGDLLYEGQLYACGIASPQNDSGGNPAKVGTFQLSITGFPELTLEEPSSPHVYQRENGLFELGVVKILDAFEHELMYFNLYIDSHNSEFLVCRVTEYPEGSSVYTYFVSADSPDEAQTILKDVLSRI